MGTIIVTTFYEIWSDNIWFLRQQHIFSLCNLLALMYIIHSSVVWYDIWFIQSHIKKLSMYSVLSTCYMVDANRTMVKIVKSTKANSRKLFISIAF